MERNSNLEAQDQVTQNTASKFKEHAEASEIALSSSKRQKKVEYSSLDNPDKALMGVGVVSKPHSLPVFDVVMNGNSISEPVKWLVSKGGGELRVTLNPPEMGHLLIQVKNKGGKISVDLSVENHNSLSQLESSIHELRSAIQSDQVVLERLDIHWQPELSLQSLNSGMHYGDSQNPQQQGAFDHSKSGSEVMNNITSNNSKSFSAPEIRVMQTTGYLNLSV